MKTRNLFAIGAAALALTMGASSAFAANDKDKDKEKGDKGGGSVVALANENGGGNDNGNGNPVILQVNGGSCDLFAPPYKCAFSGNINSNDDNLNLVEEEYNTQDPDVTPEFLELSDLLFGEFTPNEGSNLNEGSVDANFVVDFFAVKGGNGFILYKHNEGDDTFDWTTLGLVNNGGQRPALSHLIWFGHCDSVDDCDGGGGETGGPIPEPGTWALMILGFGGAGAMLRRRRVALA